MPEKGEWKVLHPGKRACRQYPDEILERILQAFPSKTILDVGCGNGTLVFCLRKMGYSAEGIDTASSAALENVGFSQWNFIRQQDIEEAEIKKYDLIFCHLSLATVTNKLSLLRKLLAKSETLILQQVILLDGVSYSEKTRYKGIWKDELDTLLAETGANVTFLYSETDEYGRLRNYYALQ